MGMGAIVVFNCKADPSALGAEGSGFYPYVY